MFVVVGWFFEINVLKKIHFNFILIVVSEASTKEYQEYLPDEVLEAGIKVVRERDFLMEELLFIMMINFYQHSVTNAVM